MVVLRCFIIQYPSYALLLLKWNCFGNFLQTTIENNKIVDTVDFGIRLVKSNGNVIRNNNCLDNPVGIGLMSGSPWAYKIDADSNYNNITSNMLTHNSYGIRTDTSNNNIISRNNFLHNERNALFNNSYSNRWKQNYWDRPRILPKPIIVKITIWGMSFYWVNFEFCPAKRPYEIS